MTPPEQPEQPRYLRTLIELFQQGKFTPGLTELTICHDDWCRIHRGEPCNCDPDIYLGTGPAKRKLA